MTIKTKFNIKDTVFCLKFERVHSFEIAYIKVEIKSRSKQSILAGENEFYQEEYYSEDREGLNGGLYFSHKLFNTKEELLKSL